MKNKKLFIFLFLFFVFCFFLKERFYKTSVIEIPFHYSQKGFILIDSIIEDEIYPLKLFLGRYPLFLKKSVIDKIKKTKENDASVTMLSGENKLTRSYIIPNVFFGANTRFAWKNVTVLESPEEEYPEEKSSKNVNEDIYGAIGSQILEQKNLFFDLPNKKIYACNHLNVLQKKKIAGKNFIKTPIEINTNLMQLEVCTSFKKSTKLAIGLNFNSTAISKAFLENSSGKERINGGLFFSTEQFVINEKDFGKTDLMSFSFDQTTFPFDGFLGLDFFEKHAIYIDYKNKFLYIGDSVNKNI